MYNAMKSYGVTQLENHTCGFRGFGFILVSRHGLGDWYFEECLLLIIHLFYSSCVIPVGGVVFYNPCTASPKDSFYQNSILAQSPLHPF